MKVGDLVTWHTSHALKADKFPIFFSKDEKYGLLIRIDYERSYLKNIGMLDKNEYSHQVLVGEKLWWFKPSDLEVIETL